MAAGCACVKARGTVDGNRHARARYARGASWSPPLSRGRHRAGEGQIIIISSSVDDGELGDECRCDEDKHIFIFRLSLCA